MMYRKSQLESLSFEALVLLAQPHGIKGTEHMTHPQLVERLLALSPPEEASGFVGSANDLDPAASEDASGFISQGDQRGEASGFVGDEGSASGFIGSEQEGSEFMGVVPEGSEFMGETDPSRFESELDDRSPLPRSGPSEKSQVHRLGPGDRLELNGHPYDILSIISQSSGEAVIYKVQNQAGEPLALKLYREARNQRREPNAEALARIREIQQEDILKLHDFGTGDQKYLGKYCFELSTFAQGGDLLSVPDFRQTFRRDFLLQQLIPQLVRGIQTLHDRKIFHCDLKPQNVFFLDEGRTHLVIGDYGSAKTFAEQSEHEHKKYSEVIGTKTYLAPEQAIGIISEKNDYYSLGMILLHLLYPELIAREDDPRRIDREKLHKINERQYEQVSIATFPASNRRLNQLIEGLTLYNVKYRWGREEVQRWLRGESVSVTYHAQSVIKPIKLGWTTIRMPEDVVRAVEEHPAKEWYADLIQDEINFRSLLIWLNELRDARQRKAFQQMVMYYQDESASGVERDERIPYLREALIRFFDPYRPLELNGRTFDFIQGEELSREITGFFQELDRLWKEAELNKLRFSLFKFEFALRQAELLTHGERQQQIRKRLDLMAERLKMAPFGDFAHYQCQLQQVVPTQARQEAQAYKVLLHLLYLFIPNRGFHDHANQDHATLEEVGLFFGRRPELFGNRILQLEKAFFLHSVQRYELHKLGYETFLFEVFQQEVQTHFELDKIVLESDREVVFRYQYYKSLSGFFQRHNISNELVQAQTGTDEYTVKRGVFQLPGAVFQAFLDGVKRKHNIPEHVLTQENVQKLRSKTRKQLWLQGLLLHTEEAFGALMLLLPLTGLAALGGLTNEAGVPLYQQYVELTQLNHYVEDPETYFNHVRGFYGIFAFFLATYLLALLPRIWCGKKLALAGRVYEREPDLLALSTSSVAGLFILMLFAPVVFSFSNWLWEFVAWAMLLVMGGGLMFATGGMKAKLFGGLVLLSVGARVLLMVEQGFDNWYGRGIIDLGLYLLIFMLAIFPPIIYQLFKAHSTLYFALKVAALALLIALFVPSNIGHFKENWLTATYELPGYDGSRTPADMAPSVEKGMFWAKIKSRYELVNVREGRSVKTSVIAQVPAGQRFKVYKDNDNNWWLVETEDGTKGYMHSSMMDLIQNIAPEASSQRQ